MEYHDCLVEEEAKLAIERAEAEVALSRKQAMIAQKKREIDLAIANAELNAFELVEREEQGLPNDDESIGKQSYIQQYIESQNELKAQAIAGQQGGKALPHKHVTLHDLKEPASGVQDHELICEVDKQIDNEPQAVNLNPRAQSFVPYSYSSINNARQICLDPSQPAGNVSTNTCDFKCNPSPIEPSTFSGEPIEFLAWMKNFEAFVNSRTNCNSDKLAYLYKYLNGVAKDSISMAIECNSEDDYTMAKNILRERFGNKRIIADAYTKKLMKWPPILKGNK